MSDTKAAVAAMMKLPKAERLERLVAMSAECVARQEDAAPLLSLIQLELNTPDPDDDPPSSRPASSTSTSITNPPPPKAKSMRRQLKEKRDELRAMLAKVDGALGSSSQSGRRPDAVAFAHMSRGEKLQLARQSGFRVSGGAGKGTQRIEVPEFIKQRFREEYDTDPEAFRKTWEQQTPEFRRQCSEPIVSKPPTPKGQVLGAPPGSAQSEKARLDALEVEALLRKAQGGKAKVGDARAAGSTFSF